MTGATQAPILGESVAGVRLGLAAPAGSVEAGGTVRVELVCENHGATPVWVFGFKPGYPRALRVSPPKQDRPWVRVSFGDTSVLHPPEAFTRLSPGERARTTLDLSFAFDRRGAGAFPIRFAYDAVRGMGGLRVLSAPAGTALETGTATLVVEHARSLREAGIDEPTEHALDALLLAGDAETGPRLRALGRGGAEYAARRFARVMSTGAEAPLGWRALEALELLGDEGLGAVAAAGADLPHAAPALTFAFEWLRFRMGRPTPEEHLPFVTALELLRSQPDRRGNFVLSWTPHDSPVHGSRRVEIFGQGDRIVVTRPPGQSVPTTRRTLVSAMQMSALFETLLWSGVWLLRPLRAHGAPDEPRPALEVQLELGEPYARKIALWNGEWRQGPGFRLADVLDRLADAVRTDATSLPPGGR